MYHYTSSDVQNRDPLSARSVFAVGKGLVGRVFVGLIPFLEVGHGMVAKAAVEGVVTAVYEVVVATVKRRLEIVVDERASSLDVPDAPP